MSKLFDLYVFKKLNACIPPSWKLQYHKKFGKQEPDFLLRSADSSQAFVIDTKYKPRYEHQSILVEMPGR